MFDTPGPRCWSCLGGSQGQRVPAAAREEIDLLVGLPLVGLEEKGRLSVDNLQFA